MKTMMLPKWLRFKLNVTSYPHSTDVFFRNIISDIVENGKKTGKKNLISLMAENIIDDSEELTASKGMTKVSKFSSAVRNNQIDRGRFWRRPWSSSLRVRTRPQLSFPSFCSLCLTIPICKKKFEDMFLKHICPTMGWRKSNFWTHASKKPSVISRFCSFWGKLMKTAKLLESRFSHIFARQKHF